MGLLGDKEALKVIQKLRTPTNVTDHIQSVAEVIRSAWPNAHLHTQADPSTAFPSADLHHHHMSEGRSLKRENFWGPLI